MKYYQIIPGIEYSKSKGAFGLVDTVPDAPNEYALEDGASFPLEMVNAVKFVFEGSQDDRELGDDLADFQMMYSPWRLISDKLYQLLAPFSGDTIYYHPVSVTKGKEQHNYFLMHFNATLTIDRSALKEQIGQDLNLTDVFVPKENLSSAFMVSEKVKQELENNSITGVAYQSL